MSDSQKALEEAKKAYEEAKRLGLTGEPLLALQKAYEAALKLVESGASATAEKVENALKSQATAKDLAILLGGMQGVNNIMSLLGVESKLLTENITGLKEAFLQLHGASKQEIEIANALQDAFSLKFGPALQKIVQLLNTAALNAQKFQVQLVQYGQDQSFSESIRKQAQELAFLGIKYSELKDANLGLITNYNASIKITKESGEAFEKSRQNLSQLSAFNKKFGIDLAESAKIMNFTNDTLGVGSGKAVEFSETLQKFAESTGQNVNTVFTSFNSQLDRFSVMSGEKAIQTFERMQMTAKRTGQSLESVFNSVAKFDEIDEGFRTGGQLNRVLSFMGGSFDTFKAIQSSDEERAQMMYQAISGVADKYSQMTTEQGKRSMAKQIAEASGVDLKTVVGLLNKSTDLTKDIADISKRDIVTGGYAPGERAEKIASLSTRTDFQTARDELLEVTNAAQKMADNFRKADEKMNAAAVKLYDELDKKVLTPIFNPKSGNIKQLFDDLKRELPNAVKEIMQGPVDATTKMAGKVADAVDSVGKKMDQPVKLIIYYEPGTGVPKAAVKP